MIKTETMQLLLSEIDRTSDTQVRAAMNPDAIAEIKRLIDEGKVDQLPAIEVFFDKRTYHIADGWHRFEAHFEAGLESIFARVQAGSERDARMFACGANTKHGVRRTQADRRRAVEVLLADQEWSTKSSREIGDHAGVHHTTVETIRKERAEASGEFATSRTGADGRKVNVKEPKPKDGPSSSKTEAATAVAEAPATNGKPKGGGEKIAPELRKEARKAFGVVTRFVDKLGKFEGADVVAEALEQIADAMKAEW
jgi:hypothetical protein